MTGTSDAYPPQDFVSPGVPSPSDEQNETHLLGTLILHPHLVDILAQTCPHPTPIDFANKHHRTIFRHMLALEDGPEIGALKDSLETAGDLTKIGGPSLLMDLAAAGRNPGNVSHYANLVIAAANKRRAVFIAHDIIKKTTQGIAGDILILRAAGQLDDLAKSLGNNNHHVEDAMAPASSHTPTPSTWLFAEKIPLGGITIIAGDPGLGKSTVTLDLAARVSTGGNQPLSQEPTPKGSVLILNAEDTAADTIVPRLEVAHADTSRVFLSGFRDVRSPITGEVIPMPMSIASDMKLIREMVKKLDDCKLLIIDPIEAFYGGGIDGNKSADVRWTLGPLSKLAEDFNLAVILVSHLNKAASTSKALYRVMGSVGLIAAARAAWAITRCEEGDVTKRLFLPLKNNKGEDGHGMAFRLAEPTTHKWVRAVHWIDEEVNVDLEDAVNPERGETKYRRDDCIKWLQELLEGGPKRAKDIEEKSKDEGFSRNMLYTAARKAGVDRKRETFGGEVRWSLKGNRNET